VTSTARSSPAPAEAPARDGIISQRLADLMDDMLAAQAPNAGRFCCACFHPLARDRTACPFCGIAVSEVATVEAVPREIIEAHHLRRKRESLVVKSFAWVGLSIGVFLALLPLILAGVQWWTFALFFVLMFGFYVASANLANWIGDAIGYRWGQSTFRRRWDAYMVGRGEE
jgi:hypothetical protein